MAFPDILIMLLPIFLLLYLLPHFRFSPIKSLVSCHSPSTPFPPTSVFTSLYTYMHVITIMGECEKQS